MDGDGAVSYLARPALLVLPPKDSEQEQEEQVTKLRTAALAAIAVLTAIAAIDESNVVGQVARKAIEIIRFALLGS